MLHVFKYSGSEYSSQSTIKIVWVFKIFILKSGDLNDTKVEGSLLEKVYGEAHEVSLGGQMVVCHHLITADPSLFGLHSNNLGTLSREMERRKYSVVGVLSAIGITASIFSFLKNPSLRFL